MISISYISRDVFVKKFTRDSSNRFNPFELINVHAAEYIIVRRRTRRQGREDQIRGGTEGSISVDYRIIRFIRIDDRSSPSSATTAAHYGAAKNVRTYFISRSSSVRLRSTTSMASERVGIALRWIPLSRASSSPRSSRYPDRARARLLRDRPATRGDSYPFVND